MNYYDLPCIQSVRPGFIFIQVDLPHEYPAPYLARICGGVGIIGRLDPNLATGWDFISINEYLENEN